MDEHGMSQAEIAYVMDIDQSTVSRALSEDRRRYKREESGRYPLMDSGCSIKTWHVDEDTAAPIISDKEVDGHADPTREEAEVLEFYEKFMKGEDQ